MTMEIPWVSITEAAPLFGMKPKSAQDAIFGNRFPVPTYRLGKKRVIDRAVLKEYFDKKRAEGLSALANTPK